MDGAIRWFLPIRCSPRNLLLAIVWRRDAAEAVLRVSRIDLAGVGCSALQSQMVQRVPATIDQREVGGARAAPPSLPADPPDFPG